MADNRPNRADSAADYGTRPTRSVAGQDALRSDLDDLPARRRPWTPRQLPLPGVRPQAPQRRFQPPRR